MQKAGQTEGEHADADRNGNRGTDSCAVEYGHADIGTDSYADTVRDSGAVQRRSFD